MTSVPTNWLTAELSAAEVWEGHDRHHVAIHGTATEATQPKCPEMTQWRLNKKLHTGAPSSGRLWDPFGIYVERCQHFWVYEVQFLRRNSCSINNRDHVTSPQENNRHLSCDQNSRPTKDHQSCIPEGQEVEQRSGCLFTLSLVVWIGSTHQADSKKGTKLFRVFYRFITKLRRNMSTVYSRSKHDT